MHHNENRNLLQYFGGRVTGHRRHFVKTISKFCTSSSKQRTQLILQAYFRIEIVRIQRDQIDFVLFA